MNRFIPRTDSEQAAMLASIGASSVEDLLSGIPANLRLRRDLDLPPAAGELPLSREVRRLAAANRGLSDNVSFLGGGWYKHFTPAAVDAIVQRSEFTTAYTPYQAEASQGSLQQIFEYQTMIAELTGMEVANASLYDGATALVEALVMASAAAKGRRHFVLARTVNPRYVEVARTYSDGLGWTFHDAAFDRATGRVDPTTLDQALAAARQAAEADGTGLAALVTQSPNFLGLAEDLAAARAACDRAGVLLVAVADPLSCALLEPPGTVGADIAVGEVMGFGIPTSLGGPALGYLSTRKQHLRQMPGRVVGRSIDAQGRRAYVLTAQTREQHIRREKATSNICSNQGLMTVAASVHLSLLGPEGLEDTARQCAERLAYLSSRLAENGVRQLHPGFAVQERVFLLPAGSRERVSKACLDARIFPGIWVHDLLPELPADALLSCVSETHTAANLNSLVLTLSQVLEHGGPL